MSAYIKACMCIGECRYKHALQWTHNCGQGGTVFGPRFSQMTLQELRLSSHTEQCPVISQTQKMTRLFTNSQNTLNLYWNMRFSFIKFVWQLSKWNFEVMQQERGLLCVIYLESDNCQQRIFLDSPKFPLTFAKKIFNALFWAFHSLFAPCMLFSPVNQAFKMLLFLYSNWKFIITY